MVVKLECICYNVYLPENKNDQQNLPSSQSHIKVEDYSRNQIVTYQVGLGSTYMYIANGVLKVLARHKKIRKLTRDIEFPEEILDFVIEDLVPSPGRMRYSGLKEIKKVGVLDKILLSSLIEPFDYNNYQIVKKAVLAGISFAIGLMIYNIFTR